MTTPQGAAAPSERDSFVRCAHVHPGFGCTVEVDFDAPDLGEHAWLRLRGAGAFAHSCLTAEEARTVGEGLLRAARQLTERQRPDALLQRSADKASPRRFTGEPITGFGCTVEVDFDAPDIGGHAWLRLRGAGISALSCLKPDEARTIGEGLLRAARQLTEREATAAALARSADKAAPRRFTGDPITGFGAL